MNLRVLARKTGWMGLLQLLNHAPPLAALAVVSRALGPAQFGHYSVLLGISAYVSLVVDFGFNITATNSAAQSGGALEVLRPLFKAVIGARLVLATAAAVAVAFFGIVYGARSDDWQLGVLVVAQAIATSMTPTWFFVGLQRPEHLLIPFGVCRIGTAIAAVSLVRNPGDILTYAFIGACGNMALLAWVGARSVSLGAQWQLPTWPSVRTAVLGSISVFSASIAINAYTAASPLIVAATLGTAAAGQYALADRVRQIVMGALTPVYQAVFPVACRAALGGTIADRRLRMYAFAALLAMGAAASLALFLLADVIVEILGGPKFHGALEVLKITSALPLVLTASTILGTHVMVPGGLRREFSAIATSAAVIGVPMLVFWSRRLGLRGAGLSMVLTEFLAFTLLCVTLHRRGLLTPLFRIEY
jgi:O-antigen/teichoic acid export membrane protein